MCSLLGIEFLSCSDDTLIARMPVDHRTKQPAGLLHGGASVALAETLGSVASSLCLDLDQQQPVGLEINANHHRQIRAGFVIGEVKPLQLGRQIHVWEIKIRDEKANLICSSKITVMIIERRK